ncbi:MAG: hypothetical protein JST92_14490 [Deltaproteobacteria bacterium]|nr:hypothetical protein [Deltaproteobacteria bacterium]
MKTIAIAVAFLLSPVAAFAAAQTHHCEIDGKEVSKTKKECHKAKGKWAKGAPTAAPAAK